jgi:hypothetical protein
MFTDVTRDIKAYLYDRARSPLFVAFIASWLGWNFSGAVILFSAIDLHDKFDMWRTIYVGAWEGWARLLLYPLATSAAFILVYPWLARPAFHYWQWHHVKVKELQQKLEDKTPMTREEEKALRLATLEQQTAMQQHLGNLNTLNRELVNQRETALEQITKISNERDEVQSTARNLVARVEEMEKANKSLVGEIETRSAALVAAREQLAKFQTTEPKKSSLSGTGKVDGRATFSDYVRELGLPSAAVDVFKAIVEEDGKPTSFTFIANKTDQPQLDVEELLKGLSGRDLVNHNDANVWLTDHGRSTAVEYGLTKKRKSGRI